jgi:hypothetical protein
MQEGVELNVSLSNDSLFVFQRWDQKRYAIFPISVDEFIVKDIDGLLIRFEQIVEGKAQLLKSSMGENEIIFKRPGKLESIELDLEPFTGTYYSRELDVLYVISIENNKLKVHLKNQPPVFLKAKEGDLFEGFGMKIRFLHEIDGVHSFRLDVGNIKGLRFVKQ